MRSKTISVRLPAGEVARLEALARELGMDRPAFLKRSLQRGAAGLMFDCACQAYRDGEATLSRAAEMAGLTVREMIIRLRGADLSLNYGVDELEKDLQG